MPLPAARDSSGGSDPLNAEPNSSKAVSLRTLVSDSTLFALGSSVDRVIGFVIFPITARLLGSENFGALSLFNVSLSAALVLYSLGVPGAFFRFYSDSNDETAPGRVVGAALWISTLAALLWTPPFLYWAGAIGDILFNDGGGRLVVLLCIRSYLSSVTSIASSRLQADGSIKLLLGIQLIVSVISRGLGLMWLVLGYGVEGIILGETAGAVLGVVVIGAYGLKGTHVRVPKKLVGDLLVYGSSLVPGLISIWIMFATDKYLLRLLATDPFEQIGLYSIAERLSLIVTMINQAIAPGWRRFSFRNMNLEEGAALIGRGATIYIIGCGYIALGVCMLGDDLVRWFIGAEFLPGAAAIPALTLANLIAGFGQISQVGLHQGRKPLTISLIGVFAAVLNIFFNWLLIPTYGFVGAAVATLMAQTVLVVISYLLSQRAFRVPFEYRRLAMAAVVFIGLFWLGQFADYLSDVTATVIQAILMAAVPFILYVLGFFHERELQFLNDGWTKGMGFIRRLR